MNEHSVPIRRALVSVSDKRGLVEFVKMLASLGVEIISTGGTLEALRKEGVKAISISEVTGFPEIMDGRVKTLHPAVHGALLARRDSKEHMATLAEQKITPIDMVVVNLYPFEQTVAKLGVTLEEAIENIDIGGPSMIRSAAKNFASVAVVTSPDQYLFLAEELKKNNGSLALETRSTLARAAFRRTASYDTAIAKYLDNDILSVALPLVQTLRYGENPHQVAALYGNYNEIFSQLHGKELSYNNILDINAAFGLLWEFRDAEPTVVIVKHTNPCGVGSGQTLEEAYRKAFATDRQAPFGGIIAFNKNVDVAVARVVNEIFTEVLIAPGYDDDALELLRKKKDRRLVTVNVAAYEAARNEREVRSVVGGVLATTPDVVLAETMKVVTKRKPTAEEEGALLFAWRVAKHVKSNAIVYAAQDRTLAVGAGQMSRVDSSRIAVWKAGEAGISLRGSVVASDAFFPFADGLIAAIEAGATAVIEPGGSIRDEEVIRAADERDVAMIFTSMRHFKH